MNNAERAAAFPFTSAVFSVFSLLQTRLEISQRALRSPRRTELNLLPLGLSKMESPPRPSVARPSAALLQYLRTSQLRTRNAASTSRALPSRQRL